MDKLINTNGGRTMQTNKGPAYTKVGHEIEGTATIISDGNKVGGGGSLTYREIYG